MEKTLAKNSSGQLSLSKINSAVDLLKVPNIKTQIEKHGEQPVLNTVAGYLVKCSVSLGIQLPTEQCQILAEDILGKYPYDSLEDVVECLKKGRRGMYGFGKNNRSTINMVLISEWMAQHLEDKSAAREQIKRELAKEESDRVAGITPHVSKMLQEYKDALKKEEAKRVKKVATKADMIRSLALVKSDQEIMDLIKLWNKEGHPEEDINILEDELLERQVLTDRQKEQDEKDRKAIR